MEPQSENTLQADFELDLAKSIAVIQRERKASAKLLQRILKLGYGTSVKIMDRLEKDGIVGPAQGSKPRVIDFDKLDQALTPKPISSAIASVVNPESVPCVAPAPDGTLSDPSTQAAPETLPIADVSPVSPELIAELDQFVATAPEFKTIPPEPIKLCVIAYLPPARFNTAAFLENLRRNPPANPLITFSDDPSLTVEWAFPPTVRMKKSIELPELMDRQHGVANLAFYLAFGQAWNWNFTHFLYAEADIRVRSVPIQTSATTSVVMPWDEQLLCQFMDAQKESEGELILAGSLMLDNPFGSDPETAQRARDLLAKWNPNLSSRDPKERNKPIVCRAQRGVKDNTSMVGCNGAGAIYSVAGLRELFPEIKEHNDFATFVTLAKDSLPFDHEIGKRLWQRHKAGAFDRCAHLPGIFSSFQDQVSTEEERLSMLRSGACVLVHPIKSNTITP